VDTNIVDIVTGPRVNTREPFPPRPYPAQAAHVITSDAEAIEVAHRLAATFAERASLRDREGLLPLEELDAFSQSGLWGINIPRAYGGAGVSTVTLTEVIKIISAVDPSLGQIPQNHLVIVAHILADGSEAQKRHLFGEVLKGVRFGNAFSERGSKHVAAFETRITPGGDGFVVNGQKFYSTGALLAHLIPIVAVDAEGKPFLAFADRDAPGLEIINDWSSFGQRTTASGSVRIDNVRIAPERVVPAWQAFARPTVAGPISQIIQAAVDAGIARGTLAATVDFVRTQARPWVDSGLDHAWQDPYTISAIGDLSVRVRAAEAILEHAARAIDDALLNETEETVAEAAVLVAESKVLTTEAALLVANRLFELGGTRSTLAEHNLDRHWRNARTHTLHDPVRWKLHAIGNYHLNGVKPARHPWL